ncbi:MAG: ATP-binding cassette domain-containing protein, partial [Eubacterium sp.]
VSFSYGDRQVLKNFSLRIENGERICLYGDSGIGKTTILRLITGLEKAESNAVICTDKKFSVVFQEDRLLPFKTVEENISLFAGSDRIDDILHRLGIYEAKDVLPSQLSGGMARRASMARALAVRADVYIFDEPFTGLDEDNIMQAVKLINEITAGKTLITVLHEKEYAKLLNCTVVEVPKI